MKNVIFEVFREKIALPVLRLLQKLMQNLILTWRSQWYHQNWNWMVQKNSLFFEDFGVPRLHPLWKIVITQNFLLQSLAPNKSLSKNVCFVLNEASEVIFLNFSSFNSFHGYPTLNIDSNYILYSLTGWKGYRIS